MKSKRPLNKDWFRWDMGPSWYLMPDLFESFFEQFGKKRSDYIAIEKLTPSYRIFFENSEFSQVDVYDDVEKNRELFERIETWINWRASWVFGKIKIPVRNRYEWVCAKELW